MAIPLTKSGQAKIPMGKLLGDLLVRLPSASGNTAAPARRIPFSSGKVFSGMSHVHIANHPDIYEILRHFFWASCCSVAR